MRLLPYDSFQIETSLPPEKLVERLSKKVDQHHLAWLHKPIYRTYEYRGQVNIKEFRIRRNKRLKGDPFLPLITGRFHRIGTKTIIHVEIGPRPIALLFMLLGFGGITIGFVARVVSFFLEGSLGLFLECILAFFFLLVISLLGTLSSFRVQAAQQKKKLERLFSGKELIMS